MGTPASTILDKPVTDTPKPPYITLYNPYSAWAVGLLHRP